jgi:serine/threonine-protein kinase
MFDSSYHIIRELGRGTTGTVYEAQHIKLGRRIALKVPDFGADSDRTVIAQKFLFECQALANLTRGPDCSIPRLLVVTEFPPGHPYYVRALVEGGTLEQRVADGSMDLWDGLSVVAKVAEVVQWVHRQGFAHRNLSPANVLIAQDGTPWLIGFGRVDQLAGSPSLPADDSGTRAEIDVQGLQHLLRWLCAALRQPVPDGIDRPAPTAAAFGEIVASYVEWACNGGT